MGQGLGQNRKKRESNEDRDMRNRVSFAYVQSVSRI